MIITSSVLMTSGSTLTNTTNGIIATTDLAGAAQYALSGTVLTLSGRIDVLEQSALTSSSGASSLSGRLLLAENDIMTLSGGLSVLS
jgi:hypothetical protein